MCYISKREVALASNIQRLNVELGLGLAFSISSALIDRNRPSGSNKPTSHARTSAVINAHPLERGIYYVTLLDELADAFQ